MLTSRVVMSVAGELVAADVAELFLQLAIMGEQLVDCLLLSGVLSIVLGEDDRELVGVERYLGSSLVDWHWPSKHFVLVSFLENETLGCFPFIH